MEMVEARRSRPFALARVVFSYQLSAAGVSRQQLNKQEPVFLNFAQTTSPLVPKHPR